MKATVIRHYAVYYAVHCYIMISFGRQYLLTYVDGKRVVIAEEDQKTHQNTCCKSFNEESPAVIVCVCIQRFYQIFSPH